MLEGYTLIYIMVRLLTEKLNIKNLVIQLIIPKHQASLPAFKEVWTEYKALNAGSLQATLKRVDFAFTRFFQGLGGYPRFRSIKNYSGWTYPDGRQGFKAHTSGKNGYLELTDLKVKIQMRGQARDWGCDSFARNLYK